MRCPRRKFPLALLLLLAFVIRSWGGASVTASSASAECPAANAYDQNKTSRWSSEFSDSHWLEIDFGEEKELVGLLLFWEAAYGSSYEICCSKDRQSWTSVYKTDQGDGGIDDILFDRTTARFLRINCTRRGTAWGYSLFEVVPKTVRAPWGEGEIPDLFLLGRGGRVFVPASWNREHPMLQLTDFRNRYELIVNGQRVARFNGRDQSRRVNMKDVLRYDQFNEIELRSDGAEPHASALLMANDQALLAGLRQMLARDAKSCFEFLAKIEPEGFFPYFLTGQQGYWTVVGIPGDFKESLFGEDGTIEPYKSFTISPFISVGGVLQTRKNVELSQSLKEGFLPIPEVQWKGDGFIVKVEPFAAGPVGKATTYVTYTVRNTGTNVLSGQLHLTIRPFEINPPWQWGGLHRVPDIRFQDNTVYANDYAVIDLSSVGRFSKCSAESIEIVQDLNNGTVGRGIAPQSDYSSAALSFDFNLPVAGETNVSLAIPLYAEARPDRDVQPLERMVADRWRAEIPEPPFYCPDREIVDTVKASLAYILVNRDGPAIQPGSRSYEAAWMRDGAMTSGALLRYGLSDIVRSFLDWYAGYLMEDGRVPAIVIIGRNEVNPVKEFDSQGEFVHACWDYYRFSGDKALLSRLWPKMEKALRYLSQIRRGEVDESRKDSLDQARYYGLLPKCVSHEGYYPEPGNHSYWDDFWALKGWKDALSIARVLGRTNELDWIAEEQRTLCDATRDSIAATREFYKLDYIPGCAELGDFDPSSTAIAVTTCDELDDLPLPVLERTFDKYLEGLRKRQEPGWQGSFSPYEFRIVQALVMMGRPQDAWIVFKYLMGCRMPAAWREWPEAVYFPPRTPGYIGDMPHTWASSGFLNAFRSMYVYEDEAKGNVVLAAGVPESWITSNEVRLVNQAPTAWGPISYSMKREEGHAVTVTVRGECYPPGKILIKPAAFVPVAITNLPATVRLEMTNVDTPAPVAEDVSDAIHDDAE